MTNATVKPALVRIEQKLDEITSFMKKTTKERENTDSEISMEVCGDTKKEIEKDV